MLVVVKNSAYGHRNPLI